MRSRLRTVLILLLTLGLLGYFLRGADMHEVWAETRRANPWDLFLALLATAATYLLRALRWQYLLAPIGATHFVTAFRTTVIGFAANALLPARAGEVIRPYLLARRERLSATAVFATIILERLLDLVTVLLLFASFVFLGAAGIGSDDPGQLAQVKFGGAVAAAGSIVAFIVLFALAGHPERLGRLALNIERVLPAAMARAVARFVETFAQGLAVMRQPARLVASLALSFPLWISIAAGIWLTSRAFHITFPFSASFLVMAMLTVGVAVPTPGAIGGFHTFFQLAVQTFFGAPHDRAVGAAIVLHAISFLPVTILGLFFMVGEGLTLAGARQLAKDAAPHDGGPAPGPLGPDTARQSTGVGKPHASVERAEPGGLHKAELPGLDRAEPIRRGRK